jgi:H+-translocating NAD(P) transhydrogenase subunit alpha
MGVWEEHNRFSSFAVISQRETENSKMPELINSLFVFMLACFLGFEVIRRVSPLLHTPLMSLTNALDAIAVVGAIVLAGEGKSTFATVLGTLAVIAATSNIVGGFIITDRMLKMFKSSRSAPNK